MKKLIYFLMALMISQNVLAATMTFDAGANETGFTFHGWSWSGGRMNPSAPNVNEYTQITKNTGTWNVVSFETSPGQFAGNGLFEVTDDLGHVYRFNPNALPANNVTTLNWTGISWLKIQLIQNGDRPFNSYTLDNIVYTVPLACPPVATATQEMNWTGTASTDWNNACNWSPNGIPTATNPVVINDATNDPVVLSGTTAAAKEMYINAGATLTVNSGGTLNINITPVPVSIYMQGSCTIINNGTINTGTGSGGFGSQIDATSTIINRGTLNMRQDYGVVVGRGSLTFTNESTGIVNGGFRAIDGFDVTLTNRGTINYSGSLYVLHLNGPSSIVNDGTIQCTAGFGILNQSGSTITNSACGKILMSVVNYYKNSSTTTNAGLISISNNLDNLGGTFTNTGVLKYGSTSGNAVTNNQNSSVIVNNSLPIFTYGSSFNGTINGIFTNAAATTSAGTFTAPNTFTPSSYPAGTVTYYAKITPSGGACSYIVPFTYKSPTLTAENVTNPTTCGGTGSIDFTTTNVTNGTYALSFKKDGANSSQMVAVSSSGTFTLSSLTAGTYSDFSLDVLGSAATASDSKTIANPSAPTITAGNVTNNTAFGGTSGSIAFTSTNLPNGTYPLSFTASAGATASPKDVTVTNNSFSLDNLKSGTYSNFSVTNQTSNCTGSTATSKVVADPAQPTLTAGAVTHPTTCSGSNGSIAFTTTNVANGTYTLSFTKTSNVTSPQNVTVTNNAFSLGNLLRGDYSNFSLSVNGTNATASVIKTVNDPATPTLTVGTAINPVTCGGSSGSIAFTSTNLPNGTYSLSFTASAGATSSPQNVTVSSNVFTLTGLKAGTYNGFSVTNNGCTGSVATSKTLTNPALPTLTAGTTTNPTTCAGTNGSIAFTSTNLPNGTYSLSFTASAGATTSPQNVIVSSNVFTLIGLKSGTYNGFSVTNNGCTGSVATSKALTDPSAPTLMAGAATNTTTCGGTNGKIAFTSTNLPNGTYSLSFTATGVGATTSPKDVTVSGGTFNLTGLKSGTYSNFSVTKAGCTVTITDSKTVNDPSLPTITAGTVSNPTTCGGTGSIPFTSTNLADGTYSLGFTATGASATASPKSVTVAGGTFSLSSLAVGTYSNFSLVRTGCTATDATSKSIANPTTPTLVAGTKVNPTSCGGTDGSIPFTTNLPNGTYSLSYTGAGSPKNVTVSAGAFNLTGLASGGYSQFTITNNGCTKTIAAPRSLSDPTPPVLTLGTTSNPTACNLSDGTIAFTITNIINGTYTLSYSVNGVSASKSVTVSGNAFTLTGLADGAYGDFSITNTSGCTGSLDADVTLSDLALPVLTIGTPSNPTTCSGTEGAISFTSANLPNATYSLSFTASAGATTSPKNVTVSGNTFTLTGLKAGTYSNFSITHLGCTGGISTPVTLIAPAAPSVTAGLASNPTTCAGADGEIDFTSANLPNGTYSLSFTASAGATASPKNVIVSGNTFTLTGLKAGTYSAFLITNNNCTGSDATSKTLSDPATPTITAGLPTSPSSCSTTDGSIAFISTNLPDGDYTLTYTGTGTGATAGPKTVTVTGNAFSLTGLDNGTYSNFSLSNNGCTATHDISKTVSNPTAPTLTAGTPVNPTTCASSDGKIPFSTSLANGTYTLNYTGAGSPKTVTVTSGAFELTGLSDGTFSGFSVTVGGCTGIANTPKTLSDPASPTITAGLATNPTTCGGAEGSIPFTTSLPNGTYTVNYTGGNGSQSVTVASGEFTLSNLTAGTYNGFSITVGGCTSIDNTTKTLNDPSAPTLAAATPVNPTTCAGTNGSIPFTTTGLANGTYTLNYTKGGTAQTASITVASNAFTLSNLTAGSYAAFSINNAGCTGSDASSKTLNAPISPTLTAGMTTNPGTFGGNDGNIAFTTNLPNGTYTLNYTKGGVAQSASVTVADNSFIISGLTAGTYTAFSITNNGCTGSDATSKTLANTAILTLGTTVQPTTCVRTNGSIAFTSSGITAGSQTLSYTIGGTPTTASITVASNGSFTLSGLGGGVYTNFAIGAVTAVGSKTLAGASVPNTANVVATNASTCLFGSIKLAGFVANTTYTVNYQRNGSPMPTLNLTANASGELVINSLSIGSYTNIIVSKNGCSNNPVSVQIINDDSKTGGVALGVSPSSCNVADGKININNLNANQSYWVSYRVGSNHKSVNATTNNDGLLSIENLSTGFYQNIIVSLGGGCTVGFPDIDLVAKNAPTYSVVNITQPITCRGEGIILLEGLQPSITYDVLAVRNNSEQPTIKLTTTAAGQLVVGNLLDGRYFVKIGLNGCIGTGINLTLQAPPRPTIETSGEPIYPSVCGQKGSIAFKTTNLNDGEYWLAYQLNAIEQKAIKTTIANGVFTVGDITNDAYYSHFTITDDAKNCKAVSFKAIPMFKSPMPSIKAGRAYNPNNGNNGRIEFTTTNVVNGSYSIGYNGLGSPKTVNITSNAFVLGELSSGSYRDFTITYNGCTATDPTVKTLQSSARLGIGNNEMVEIAEAYPNPTTDKVTVVLNGLALQNVQLRLVNMIGSQIQSQQITPTSQKHVLQLELKNLPNGLYLLHATGHRYNQTLKIIKTQ